MDYWCALWFWPIEEAELLPSRDEWILELQVILEGTARETGPSILGPEQVSLPGVIARSEATKQSDGDLPRQEQLRLDAQLGEVDLEDLCARHPRLALVRSIGVKHRFLHWELEFADIFRDRGGFDLTLGNPPWIKIEWNEGGVMGDVEPLYVIRKMAAPEMARLRSAAMEKHPGLHGTYLAEYVELTGLQNFLNARQNYALLEESQSNTYKCFLSRAWDAASSAGVQGFLHPEGVYDDPKGGVFRRELYQRLRYHFQFVNEKQLFPEVDHHALYSVNVHGSPREVPAFSHIANLFVVPTVDSSFELSARRETDPVFKENAVPVQAAGSCRCGPPSASLRSPAGDLPSAPPLRPHPSKPPVSPFDKGGSRGFVERVAGTHSVQGPVGGIKDDAGD